MALWRVLLVRGQGRSWRHICGSTVRCRNQRRRVPMGRPPVPNRGQGAYANRDTRQEPQPHGKEHSPDSWGTPVAGLQTGEHAKRLSLFVQLRFLLGNLLQLRVQAGEQRVRV